MRVRFEIELSGGSETFVLLAKFVHRSAAENFDERFLLYRISDYVACLGANDEPVVSQHIARWLAGKLEVFSNFRHIVKQHYAASAPTTRLYCGPDFQASLSLVVRQ
jgi:hypothetical protein